jgi:hypothetical protein
MGVIAAAGKVCRRPGRAGNTAAAKARIFLFLCFYDMSIQRVGGVVYPICICQINIK